MDLDAIPLTEPRAGVGHYAFGLARSLVGLLDDEGARRELSLAGLRRAAEFSWEHAARMTLEVYAEA